MKNNYFKFKKVFFCLGLATALASCNEPREIKRTELNNRDIVDVWREKYGDEAARFSIERLRQFDERVELIGLILRMKVSMRKISTKEGLIAVIENKGRNLLFNIELVKSLHEETKREFLTFERARTTGLPSDNLRNLMSIYKNAVVAGRGILIKDPLNFGSHHYIKILNVLRGE